MALTCSISRETCGGDFQRWYATILEFSPGKAFKKINNLLFEPVKTREVVCFADR